MTHFSIVSYVPDDLYAIDRVAVGVIAVDDEGSVAHWIEDVSRVVVFAHAFENAFHPLKTAEFLTKWFALYKDVQWTREMLQERHESWYHCIQFSAVRESSAPAKQIAAQVAKHVLR